MNQDELLAGDLIFYFNTLGIAEHIALYAGEKDGIPYVLHATTEPHRAVMLTYLKEPDPFCSYHVMRPVNQILALEAKQILLNWVKHLVPFASDEKYDRLVNPIDELAGFERADSGIIQYEYGRRTYRSNFNQYLLFANHLPYIPEENGKIQGLLCSEAVIAAFNVVLVQTYASSKEIFGKKVWNIEGDIEAFIDSLDSPLPLDAKTTFPAGIYEHCLREPAHWHHLGVLTISPLPAISEHDKAQWKEFISSLKESAQEKALSFSTSETPDLSSGADSRSSDSTAILSLSPFYCTFFKPRALTDKPSDSQISHHPVPLSSKESN
ncbi:hypothetical protein [Legionella impletisoli]|uniref:Uncharacterized protein n=1 Tax=Legionella impletisoli TaxID=343510 RepID=A0A917JSM1_9GAMM|nr:hypothetical protein [Legionella impletisoli]GGI80454.1 hypothetical protein GCM10007966_06230 [Legionella impletisoli]